MRALALPLLVLASLTGCLTSSEDFQAMLAYASDEDLDGYAPRDGDCDDFDASVHPGAEDVWYDGVDRDCDGWNDNDADHDGSPIPDDCDDTDPLVSPDFEEECDGVDEDCDGEVDEGMSGLWYADADGDGQGNPDTEVTTCLPPEGYVDVSGDCDDGDPAIYSGAVEVCGDGVVNDCAGYDGSCRVEGEVSLGEWGGDVVQSVLWGDGDQDLFGASVTFGELNGDGIADIIIGAPLNDINGRDAGAAHVLLSPHGSGELEMPGDAFASLVGGSSGYQAGFSVGVSGDIDDDGLDEILTASHLSSYGNQGIVNVGGTPQNSGTADLSLGQRALLLPDPFGGGALVPLGDVDGDTENEFAIGHASANNRAGAVYIWGYFLGIEAVEDGDAVLSGEARSDGAGTSIAKTSDFNGDGVHDLLVGAPSYDNERGVAYLFEGPVSGSLSLSTADAKLLGEEPGDHAGAAVGGSGDVDGDGLDDLVVGAPEAMVGQDLPGKVYLFTATPTGALDISNAARVYVGDVDKSEFGSAVELGSDMDGDGHADLIITAPSQNGDEYGAGAAFVYFDPLRGATSPEGAELSLWGEGENFGAGRSLAGGRDTSGDGVDDLILGSPTYWLGSAQLGAAHVILGTSP